MMIRARVDVSEDGLNDVRSRGENKTRWMIAINEIGIYEALYSSRRSEARKFRRWSASVMQKLRKHVGLEGYEVMRMTDPDVQEEIDHFLDDIFYDEETGQLMRSVTVAGGDVIQEPFEFLWRYKMSMFKSRKKIDSVPISSVLQPIMIREHLGLDPIIPVDKDKQIVKVLEGKSVIIQFDSMIKHETIELLKEDIQKPNKREWICCSGWQM